MVDYLRILIILVLVYVAFLIFSKLTSILFRIAIVAVIILIISFGFVDLASINPFAEKSIEHVELNKINEDSTNMNFTELNETNSSELT